MAKALKWSCGRGEKQAVEFPRVAVRPWALGRGAGAVGAGRPGWVGVRVSAVWGGPWARRWRGTRAWGALEGLQFLKRAAVAARAWGLTSVLGRSREECSPRCRGRALQGRKAFLVGQAVQDAARVKNPKTLGFRGRAFGSCLLYCFEIL